MSVSIITFANLGRKENLKTPDVLPIISAFIETGELKQVICQINTKSAFPGTVSAIPAIIRYTIRACEKIYGKDFPRRITERLFDWFASRKLTSADIVFFHGGYFLPNTVRKARSLGSLVVDIPVSAHIATNAVLESKELDSLGFGNYRGWYVMLNETAPHINSFNYIIALSDFVKESYVKAGFPGERIYVASPDIDTARFSPVSGTPTPNKKFRVLYVAYTAQLKGLHYLLDAWDSLKLSDAELILVGGYGDMPDGLAEQYNAIINRNPSITLHRSSTRPEDYYHTASVLVFPSLTEGFGRVTLEAMACGLPVITTENARGIVEDGKTGFVVPIRDAYAIREKLEYLYHHRDVAQQMGKAAREAVERKQLFGAAVYEIYQEIVRRENKTKA